jgi:hypothetical protein
VKDASNTIVPGLHAAGESSSASVRSARGLSVSMSIVLALTLAYVVRNMLKEVPHLLFHDQVVACL